MTNHRTSGDRYSGVPPPAQPAGIPADVCSRLADADRMMSLGRLVAGIAHEINNPSSFITINVQVLKDLYAGLLPELDARHDEQGDFPVAGLMYSQARTDIVHLLDGIETGALRIKDTIHWLQDYSRPTSAGVVTTVNLNDVVRAAGQLLHTFVRRSTHRFDTGYADSLPALAGDFQRLVQVVIALIQNACEALPDRDRAVRIRTHHDQAAHMATLVVEDEGVGIAAEDIARVFDPFFTTKQERGCLGLGLYAARQILAYHHALISCQSLPGEGTTVTVQFPLPPAHHSPQARP